MWVDIDKIGSLHTLDIVTGVKLWPGSEKDLIPCCDIFQAKLHRFV